MIKVLLLYIICCNQAIFGVYGGSNGGRFFGVGGGGAANFFRSPTHHDAQPWKSQQPQSLWNKVTGSFITNGIFFH